MYNAFSVSRLALLVVAAVAAAGILEAQPGRVDNNVTSEWESTGFNNGRRIVRDSNGYFHAFWHSRPLAPIQPTGTGCELMYAHTTVKANEPPSMAAAGQWTPPVAMTQMLGNLDNRYPAIAIEYDTYDGQWKQTNTIHVVWQALRDGPQGPRYEIMYASLPVSDPPGPGAPFNGQTNLSQTPTDSLVPSIAINMYGNSVANQHLHVVWQEEDVFSGGQRLPAEDLWYSQIAYVRGVTNTGTGPVVWSPPGGGWDPDGPGPQAPYPWDNLSNMPSNAQMPSVSCVLDQYTTTPAVLGIKELGYNSDDVHVAFNEDLPGGSIHVFYVRSPDNGVNWLPRTDVSVATSIGGEGSLEAYPCIAVDMLDNPHIVFMHNYMVQREPLRTGALVYQAGIDPSQWYSFPGPEVGMYAIGALTNSIGYAYFDGLLWNSNVWAPPSPINDLEFPTVSLDRWQHVNVNWQLYTGTGAQPPPYGDYEIFRDTNLNMNAPWYPLTLQTYFAWSGPMSDSQDPTADDLFPNLAHKKTSMYFAPAPESGLAGYDEVWTKIYPVVPGVHNGPADATAANNKQVWQDGNMNWDVSCPVTLSSFAVD